MAILGKRKAGGRSKAASQRPRKRAARAAMVRRPRSIASVVYPFKRMFGSFPWQQGNVSYAPFVQPVTFALNQLPNVTEFSNLFDQYRINFLVYKFYLRIDPSAQTAATASFPKMYWYRDYDDSAAPSNLNEIRESGRSRVAVLRPDRPVTVKFKPNTLINVWNTGLTSATQSPVWDAWVDVANVNTTHYGFKMAIDDFTNTNYRLDLEVFCYFQCKSVR